MTKCEICKYQKDCPDMVEENSIYCLTHRRIPKNFNNEYIKKQQLISFLKDKIKENNKKQEGLNAYESCYSYCEGVNDILQEVLDFVKGGKDE